MREGAAAGVGPEDPRGEARNFGQIFTGFEIRFGGTGNLVGTTHTSNGLAGMEFLALFVFVPG